MRKNWVMLACVLLLVTVISVGCSTTTNTATNTTTKTSSTSTTTSVATSQVSSSTTPTLPDVQLAYPDITRITANDLNKMIAAGTAATDLVIVDTRTADIFAQGHIPGAVDIPDDPTNLNLEQKLKALPKNKTIVFYCNCSDESGSAGMATFLISLGWDAKNMRALRGGIAYWTALQYPQESGYPTW
jgi:rhodanese-related sulfurtransferase